MRLSRPTMPTMPGCLVLTVVCCLMGLAGAQLDGKCPSGWLSRPNSNWCYQVSDTAANYKTWSDAKKACELQHAYLLSIADTEERAWLAQNINFYSSRDKYWWFGLSRFSGSWVWDDGHTGNEQPGSPGSGTLLYWWSAVSDATPGNCMTIYQDTGSKSFIRVWPRDCDLKFKYVCKKLKQEVTTCDTDNGWELQNKKCYKVYNFDSNDGANWDEARSKCNADESDLASMPDQETNMAVRDMISRTSGSRGKNFWIGLRTFVDKSDPKGFAWRWVDDSGLTYEAWNTGSRPDVTPDRFENTCVQTVGTDERKLWKDYACDGGRFGFVCARSVGTCPTGWYQHRDSCYSIHPTELSWDEADTYCRSRNASLLQIKQKHMQDFINGYKDDFVNQRISYIWIGLYRATSKDKLAWTTGGEAAKTYTNWADEEPQLDIARPNAVRIIASNDQGRWQAANPVDRGGYVCEIPLGKVPQTPTVPPPRYSCEDGWILYGRSCYKLEIKYSDWLTARGNCRTMYPGSDLIDIRDAAEQEFIQGQLADHDFWIGLHTRSNEERQWMWSADETAASFFNWNEGEPNNGAGEENCVEMYLFGKWNDNRCTYRLPYICKAPANIGGTPQTPAPTTSLVWDPFCGPFWSRDLMSNYCYMFITDPLIWVDAKHQCEYQGGKLLSIVTDSEKSYIAGRMQEIMAANPDIVHFWIGFNDRAVEGRWVWDDGQPVPYLNWAAGEPNNDQGGEDCGIIYPVDAQWYDVPCEKRYASICKKLGNAEPTRQPSATTISVPGGYLRGCRDGYTGFNDMCYKVYGAESDAATWDAAQQKCRMDGGDLPSVTSAAEHQFLLELARPQGEFGFWVGFYDAIALQRTMYFQWTDRSPVTYTSWHIGEPNNHGTREDCVEVVNVWDGWNGGWNDLDCTWSRRFACKQRQIPVLVTQPATRPYGCSSDFDGAYAGYCLKFVAGNVPLTATAAQQQCSSIGGSLATIPSQDVQNHFFLRITELRANSDFWIGLTRVGNTYRWDDGRSVTYTYWKPGASLIGFRASMSAQTGQWQMSLTSAVTYTNYICQARQPGVTTPEPTYNPAYCAPGWIEADDTCYKGFSVSQVSSRLTWTEARTQCKTLNGDLATINSEEAITALRQTVGGFNAYWIGLNTRDSNQGFVWADGKPAKFFKWRGNNEPENINGNQNCALLNPSDMAWTIQNCNVAQNWLCETPKGIYPTGSTAEPTTAPDAPDCGDGWKYFNGSCYLFTSQTNDWHKSLTSCREKGGDLVSIHNHDESDFLIGQLSKMHISSTSYWIGLNELGQNDGFRWSDSTGVNYFNWFPGEPNNWGGAEHCGALYSNTGLWNDDQCGVMFYSICKRSNDTNKTIPPVTPMPGKCPKDFYTVGNKCYRIFDNVQVNWADARQNCEQLGTGAGIRGYLASVSSEYEQAALTTLRPKNDTPLWIGLYARSYAHLYLWHDNSEVTYTNWDYNEPNNVAEQCVEMYTEKFRAGKWNDATCSIRRGYVCMTYKSPTLVTDWVPPTVVSCKSGWTAYGQACFLFVPSAATWDGALATCSTNGGNLASIHDLWEQNHVHFRTETIGRISTWIGLSDASGSGQYAWSDKWPVTYTNWGRGQPNAGDKPSCVFMDSTGGWNVEDCNTRLPYMCRQSYGAEPTTIAHLPGTCPSEFVAFGDSCYYIGNNTESKDASEARYECSKRYRSTLVSILSQGEQDFVAEKIRQKSQDVTRRSDYWIGLLRGSDGGFEWYDFSPVSYLYWSNGEPSNTPNENCVEMYHLNLKWNDHYCSKKNSFVCKMPKLPATAGPTQTWPPSVSATTTQVPPRTPPPSESTAASTTTQTTRSPGSGGIRSIADLTNDGLVAGIVILFLVILVAMVTAIFFYRRHTGPKSVVAESGFANANWSRSTDGVTIQQDSGVENRTFST